MSKRTAYFNFLLSLIFLLGVIFPPGVFSYPGADDKKFIDESKVADISSFKKIRCPNCHMEFFYIPGKECPHSRWVKYEVSETDTDSHQGGEVLGSVPGLKDVKDAVKEIDKQNKLLSLFKLKDEARGNSAKKGKSVLFDSIGEPEYEIRQELTCPYDGYAFFPEGDLLDQSKLKIKDFIHEELSSIESSFYKSVSFSTPKDIKQFGYDLFVLPEKSNKEEEYEKERGGEKSIETLATLGLLKTALRSSTQSSLFSTESFSAETAVVPVSSDYILGPGDTLLINIWGSVQESFPAEVDREGKIMLPKAGPLYIWGTKLRDAEDIITQKLNEFYTNFNVEVSMGRLRNIKVFIMGEVKKPGVYSISSQSNIFQALYAAGGPSKLGSMRKIKIIAPDGKSREEDLYQFLLKGEHTDTSLIQSGDIVFVPPIGDAVAIIGNVKRPAIYETKSEIALSDLLDFAGGVLSTGTLQRIQVERIKDNERRVIADMELKNASGVSVQFKDINLRNGDMVIVSPIVRLKHDFVTVLGNVETPGDYGLKEGMSVSNLIESAKGLMPGSYLYRAEIARVTKDRAREIIPVNLEKMMLGGKDEDIVLKEWDILLVYSEAEASRPSFVDIDGAVNKPGRYELTPNMKISGLIFKAGGVTSQDFIRGAELFHIMPGEQPVMREIGIKRLLGQNISIDKDIILQPGDSLFVKREPKLTEKKMVTIKGEVRFPGTYPAISGERLSDLIERAGGYTGDAFLEGAVFTRKSIKEIEENMRQKFLEKERRAILEGQQSLLFAVGNAANADAITHSTKTRIDMMDFISQTEIEGRMVIKLLEIPKLKHTKYDIPLEDGDFLTIPQPSSAVTVIGNVNNQTSVPFEIGKGIDYYIQRTGGLTKHADKSGIYVIRANGEAVSKFMMTKYIERGDTIVVPQEFKYWTPPGMLLKDTVEILSRIAIGVGIIAALE